MYNVFDYPIRLFAGEHNEGSHGSYPYPGEWESAAGLGSPESVQQADKDSTRVVPHDRFRAVLTPEPGRIDYSKNPEILRVWIAFLLPVRWGFPSAASLGSMLNADVGNRAPFGPSYNAAWNRTAPGMLYTAYRIRKLSTARSFFEDLLQPWYYLYILRTPRFVHDIRQGQDRQELERLGLAPRGGWAERAIGTPILGVSIGYPKGNLSGVYNTGLFGWESRVRISTDGTQEVSSGWKLGWSAGVGVEYYLRTGLALDVGLRYYRAGTLPTRAQADGADLQFLHLWIGHLLRF